MKSERTVLLKKLLLIVNIALVFQFFVGFSLNAQHTIDLQFALGKIADAQSKYMPASNPIHINFQLDTVNLATEEYRIKIIDQQATIYGGDEKGLLYGGFEVAEQMELYQKVSETNGKPFLKKRGIKFNIPLDARTPSYDDTGDAAQKNIVEMWEWSFWEEFLDDMALHRYNTLTLWNPHPFPSMIRMPDYEDVALDDVYVTTLKPIGKENEWGEPQMVSSNVMENLKMVKKIPIEDKILFWQKVMRRAKERGIDFYFITWNISPNSVAKPVPPFYRTYAPKPTNEEKGKYGISHQADNEKTIDYHRNSIKTFLLTYPDVKGIGVTAGEHMPEPFGDYDREKWLWETFGQGILDAKNEQPGRTVHFIHRVWNSNMELIMKYWKNYPDPFEVSFKYAKARLYSSPDIHFADNHIEAMKPYALKSWWNLRNDDIFVYRWGDPDYVRQFLENFPAEHTAGYHMGSDGYVWGKEFISKDKELSGQLEIKKHWYNFMLWGRLGYDNTLDSSFFAEKLASHFPGLDAPLLYTTWQNASKIVPQVNRFYWKDWDFMWAVEACYNERKGFQTVIDFIDNPTMERSNILNPKAYVKATLSGTEITEITPLQVAENLNQMAIDAINGVEQLRKQSTTATEAKVLLDDILAMAHLGNYYAAKIEAATALAFYIERKQANNKKNAIAHLEKAVMHWKKYTEISEKHYKAQMLARTKMLDWSSILKDVQQEVETVRKLE